MNSIVHTQHTNGVRAAIYTVVRSETARRIAGVEGHEDDEVVVVHVDEVLVSEILD